MSLRVGKFILVGATCGLLAAAGHVSILIRARQEGLDAASRCSSCAAAGEVALEFARLEQKVAAAALPGSGVGPADVALRAEALRGRLSDLEAARGDGVLAGRPDAADILGRIGEALDRLAAMPAAVDRPDGGAAALRLLAPLDFDLSRLAAEAARDGETRAGHARAELARLYAVFTAVLVALFGFGAALLALLGRHNRRLAAARDRLAASTAALEAASRRLATANAETSALNAELEVRNAVLDRRDRELGLQNQRFDAALDNMPLALCMADAADRLVFYNRPFAALFELDVAPIPGLVFADLVGLARGSRLAAVHAHQRALTSPDGETGCFVLDLAPDPAGPPDAPLALSVSHRAMPGGGWVAVYEDVTRHQRAEAYAAHLARHDPLTGVGSRAFFFEQVDAAVAEAARRGTGVAVHCIDIDRLRDVNDGLGHGAGDALLREAARRLSSEAGGGPVARLGGGEFAVLQGGGGSAEALAERLGRVLRGPFSATGGTVVTASVGHASAPADAADAAGLLKAAGLALAAAKRGGRGAVRGFVPDMDAARRARRTLEADLGRALGGGEFELFYQPLVDAGRLAVTGFEALLRWHHPERGLVSPAEFVPVAEETGLIGAIGGWALAAACAEAASWPGGQTVAVNLSPAQFDGGDLVAVVDDALARSGLDPRRLELEITESVPLGDGSLAVLHAFRERGIRIAMDDFGTGYSSLSYLRRFPFDKIKIDQSFVRDLASRPDCMEIVRSIAALARSLGIRTTAEGVETVEQLARLQAAGCDQMQGFHFGPPRPAGRLLFALPRDGGAAAA